MRRYYPPAAKVNASGSAWRVDAKAEGEVDYIGEGPPTVGKDGVIDKGNSPWFAESLDRAYAGWAFAKGGQASWTIAALEALATPAAMTAFAPVAATGTVSQTALVLGCGLATFH